MPSDIPPAPQSNGEAKVDPGLPTVTPPTGTMFFRLFGVPALIVGVIVLVLIVGQPLLNKAGQFFLGRTWGTASPQQFLRDLDNTNKEVRWRAANDLAQVLLRDDNLASDSNFALQLAQRLHRTIDSSAPFEKVYAEQVSKLSKEEKARELKKLEADRDYVLLLAQCLSRFMIPVGAPALKEMAVQKSGLAPRALQARRRQALWALANLGENLGRFDKLSAEQQDAVLAHLETAADEGEQSKAAKDALDYLKDRREGNLNALGMDRIIEKCAGEDDPLLREFAAFAANFWSGTAEENARLEKTLLRLCDDPGKVEDELAEGEDENRQEATRSVVKKPGFHVQANAAVALARQGWKVRLSLLRTLLDADELRSIFVVQVKKDGTERPDEAVVVLTLVSALKAVAELHRKDPQRDLSILRPNIDNLAHSSNPNVRSEAGRVVSALSKT